MKAQVVGWLGCVSQQFPATIVLQYLRDTSDHCISFDGREGTVCGYVDVDYAGDLDKRRSTTGYVFTLAGE